MSNGKLRTSHDVFFAEKAIEMNQNYYDALRDYGYFLIERRDYPRAKAFLEKALALCSNPEEEKTIQSRLALIHKNIDPSNH